MILNNPTTDQIMDVYDKIISYYKNNSIYEKNVLVKFTEPVVLIKRNKKVFDKEFKLWFFKTKDEIPCYSFNKNTGYHLNTMDYSKIYSIESVDSSTELKESTKQKDIKSILNSRHPNVWQEGFEDILNNTYNSLKKRSITRIVPPYIIDNIKKAMDEKTNYDWSCDGKKRDYRIQVRFSGDMGKAWFTSEYSGCGNGDYYILINPTTATLKETD